MKHQNTPQKYFHVVAILAKLLQQTPSHMVEVNVNSYDHVLNPQHISNLADIKCAQFNLKIPSKLRLHAINHITVPNVEKIPIPMNNISK